MEKMPYLVRINELLKNTSFGVYIDRLPETINDKMAIIVGEIHPSFDLSVLQNGENKIIKIPRNKLEIRKIISELMNLHDISILLEGRHIEHADLPKYLDNLLKDTSRIMYDDSSELIDALLESRKKYQLEEKLATTSKNIPELNAIHQKRERLFAEAIKSEVDKGRTPIQIVGLDHLHDLSQILSSYQIPHLCIKQYEYSKSEIDLVVIDF